MHELHGQIAPSAHALRAPSYLLESAINPHTDSIINAEIDLPNKDPNHDANVRAESFHQPFVANAASRQQTLQQIYHRIGSPSDLIVMICCQKFCPFLRLWLASCEQKNISVADRTLVFTLDEIADDEVRRMGLNSYHFDQNIYQTAGGSVVFGDASFQSAMFYKNAAILETLKLGANVLFQDVDLIWLQDPIDILNKQPLNDIQIMYDGPNRRHYPYYANTGFFYVKNNPVTHSVFETALRNTAAIFMLGGHQPPLNRIMNHFAVHNLLSLTVLNETRFLNGHLFNLVNGTDPKAAEWQNNGVVIHYSWTGNCSEKIQKLEQFDYFGVTPPIEITNFLSS